MIINCLQCNKEFKQRRLSSKYCSPSCSSKNQSTRIPTDCSFCGKSFPARAYLSGTTKGKFCSRKCYNNSRRESVSVKCLSCGKNFECWKSEIPTRKFCSKKCMTGNRWKDGKGKCAICGIEKPINEFSRSKNTFTGFDSRCKSCAVQRARRHYFLKKYNLTDDKIKEMSASQNHRCLICETKSDNLFVDHCHKSGTVRGLLCSLCNSAIGLLKENPESFRRAIAYLERTVA